MRQRTGAMLSAAVLGIAVIALFSIDGRQAKADDPNSAPNPYHVVDHWAKLPPGRAWGQAIGIDIDPRRHQRLGVRPLRRQDVRRIERRADSEIRRDRPTGRKSFGAGSVQLAARACRRSRRERLGDRWQGRERQGRTVIKFEPERTGADDARQAGSYRRRTQSASTARPTSCVAPNGNIFIADGHGDGKTQRPHRQVLEGRKIHQSLGPPRIGAGRIQRAARPGDGFRGPPVRCRPLQQPHPDFRSRRQVYSGMEAVRPAERHLHPQRHYLCLPTRSRTKRPIRRSGKASASAASRMARSQPLFLRRRPEASKCRKACAADKSGNVFGGFTAKSDVKKYAKN